MISFACPRCARKFSVNDDNAGKRGKCPCGTVIVVPTHGAADVSRSTDHATALQTPSVPSFQVDADIYISVVAASDEVRFYCDRCRKAHEGFGCPGCNEEHPTGLHTGCLFCRTSYSTRHKHCPACDVDANMERAGLVPVNADREEVAEGLRRWQAGYSEARANGYC